MNRVDIMAFAIHKATVLIGGLGCYQVSDRNHLLQRSQECTNVLVVDYRDVEG